MTAKGHMLLATALASPFIYAVSDQRICIASVLIGSLMPDIDEPGSYISRKFIYFGIAAGAVGYTLSNFMIMSFGILMILLPFAIKYIFGHRGVTHVFIVCWLLIVSSYFFHGQNKDIVFGFALGYSFHTIGDMLTKSGIDGYLWPFSTRKIALLPYQLRFKTNSETESKFIIFLFLVNMLIYIPLLLG